MTDAGADFLPPRADPVLQTPRILVESFVYHQFPDDWRGAVEKQSNTAFRKAIGYLGFSPRATWAAHLAGVGTAIVVVGLLFVLWLFTDLMVWRGRVPDFSELSPSQQEHFQAGWNSLTVEEAATRAMAAEINPSRVAEVASTGFRDLTDQDKNRLWSENVQRVLAGISPDANAQVIRATTEGLDLDRSNHGILSLVVRQDADLREGVISRTLGSWVLWKPARWLAYWNKWMWNAPAARSTFLPAYLTGLFIIAFLLTLLGVGLVLLQREMAARATIEATTRLRRGVYLQTFRLGNLALRSLGPTEAVSLLTRHIESLHDALYAHLTVFYRAPITLVLMLAFAFFVHFWLSLAFLMFSILIWQLGLRIVDYYRRQSRLATNQAAERLTIIRESLMLMRLVVCFEMKQFNQARIERQLSSYAQEQLVRHRGESFYQPLLLFLGAASTLVLLFVTALIVLQGQLGVAGAVTLAITLLCLYRPVERWLDARRLIKRGQDSATLIFRFLERRGDVGQVVGAEFLEPMTKQIEFEKVSLRDPTNDRFLLEEVSLTIPAGHRVGLVGPDDLEKHALVYLIPRLLDPTAGEIRIDGRNLRWVTLESLRVQVGLVMMHNLVFHDSVANNIGCGEAAYTLPRIIEAAKLAHAHHFIQKLPRGYETPIGELGHSLSISDQFRIALARALLRNPALLIIEEPNADLDEDTKDLLDDTLTRVLPGRTAIFLPHRISTLKACNTIYLLNKGKIVAAGTHKELLGHSPLYRHLHYLEFNAVGE
jgi:ATP-binding cassette subfamily B protein